jgi:hypothetical protein
VPATPAMPADVRLINLPMFGLGSVYAGVVDQAGCFYVISKIYVEPLSVEQGGAFGIVGQLSGTAGVPLGSVTTIAGALGPDGKLRIYATDAQDKLWILRQLGTDGSANAPYFTWGAWHPLGDNTLSIANGPGNLGTSDIFALDSDAFLVHMSQNAATFRWTTQLIKKPTTVQEEPDYVPQYVTHVSVLDANATPQANVSLTVTSEEPVSIWVEGAQHFVDAENPLTVLTTGFGTVTLSTPALGLHTAKLTFQADGFAAPQTVYPPENVHARLAVVDGPGLSNATAQTQGLPPVTQPVSANKQADFAGAAKGITGAFSIPLDGGANVGRPVCRVVDMRHANTFAGLASSLALASRAGEGARSSVGGPWDAFWSDLANFGEDVYHAIRTGAIEVVGVSVDIENKTVTLELEVEGVGSNMLEFAVSTIHDVVDAVQSLFSYIEATVERLLDWLKSLFEWQDIINTKTVVEYYVNQVLQNVVADVTPGASGSIQTLVQAQFETLSGQVNAAFNAAEAAFQNTSFNGLANTASRALAARGRSLSTANPLHPTEQLAAYQSNRVRCDYVQSKSHTHFQAGGPMGAAARRCALPSDAFGDLLTLVQDNLLNNSSYSEARQKLQASLTNALANPQALFDMAVYDFLVLVQEFVQLVITLLEDVIIAMLDLIGEGISSLKDVLNVPIDIPAVSYIYKQLTGNALTVMDVACLVLATPATVLYKTAYNGPPFTTNPNADGIQVKDVLSTPVPWPQLGDHGLTTRGALPRDISGLPKLLGVLYCWVGVISAFNDMWTDWAAAADTQTPSPIVTFFSVCGILLGITEQGFSVPYKVLEKPDAQRSQADWWNLVLWSAGFLPVVTNVLFTIFSNSKAMAKFSGDYGVPLTATCGAAVLGIGINAAVEEGASDTGYSAFNQAQAIIAPVPLLAKLLLELQDDVATAILLGADLTCDFANAALGWAEST